MLEMCTKKNSINLKKITIFTCSVLSRILFYFFQRVLLRWVPKFTNANGHPQLIGMIIKGQWWVGCPLRSIYLYFSRLQGHDGET